MPDRVGQSVAQKVCGGCGQPVDDSTEVGKLYWCDWAYRKVPVRIKRAPLWTRRGEATNLEAQAPLPASVSATPEGSQGSTGSVG